MQRQVYPAQRRIGGWISCVLLLMTAFVFVTGVLFRSRSEDLSIERLSDGEALTLEETFDETPAQQEVSLPAVEWYALQLGAFESKEAAEELAAQYMRRGAAGYVWQDGRYRTLAAVYPLKDDAQLVREQLQLEHEIDTYLYQIAFPEIKIRLSGMRGQLDVLQAALIHADDFTRQIQLMSVNMDRQELSVSEAADRLAAIAQQAELVSLRMRQRFAAPRHAAVEAVLACMESFQSFCEALDANASQAAFSARLKHQTLASLNALKTVYDTLSDT